MNKSRQSLHRRVSHINETFAVLNISHERKTSNHSTFVDDNRLKLLNFRSLLECSFSFIDQSSGETLTFKQFGYCAAVRTRQNWKVDE